MLDTLRANLAALLAIPHDYTDPDGFAHNCIAHPMLWLSRRIR
jgi:hypothetical protein